MFKILMIDDSKTVHSYVKNLLLPFHEILVHSVFDGAEALQFLKTESDFNIIFLDWEMPKLNGPATFLELKKSNCKVPVLMMTTKNKVTDIAYMLELGVNEYLMKPFTVDILLEKIEYITGKTFTNAA